MKSLDQITSRDHYNKLLYSGMFWVWYPEATGNFYKDVMEKRMEIDIRNTAGKIPTTIRFGDNGSDIVEESVDKIYISQEDNGAVMKGDIDNLILALKRAKELWGDS